MQEERGPRKCKSLIISKTPSSFIQSPFNWYPEPSSLNPQHELASQILILSIRKARSNPGFGLLSRSSQDAILTQLWAPLFLLRASYWPSALACLTHHLKHFKTLELDSFELDLLESILLCRGDLLSDLRQSSLAQSARDGALRSLRVSCSVRITRKG